jgi:putative NADH-flavin reductase
MAVGKIIVVGAAGKSGSAIVTEALSRGVGVTAYVRSRAKAEGLPAAVAIVEGDGKDAAALAGALPGHDAVVVTSGGRTETVSAEVAKAVVAAMKQAGIGRLIQYSAYGANDGKGLYRWVMHTLAGKVAADKIELETVLAASELDWTAVRPGVLTDGGKSGKMRAGTGVVLKGFPQISRADVAQFVLDELQAPKFIKAAPVIYVDGTQR